MGSAITKFGEVLQTVNNVCTVNNSGPTFAWASPGDVVMMGPVPEDVTGRVCVVKDKVTGQRTFVRVFPSGKKLRLYFMDEYNLSREVSADAVEVEHEVLCVARLYSAEAEAPKASTTWEKRIKKALKGACIPYRDYGEIIRRHTDAGNWATLNVAYCLGVQAGRARQNDKA